MFIDLIRGGAMAEWDYLRGSKEGWIPPFPPPNIASVSEFGSCYDILFKTLDDTSIVHVFPSATDPHDLQGRPVTDDVVLSHGESLLDHKKHDSLISNVLVAFLLFGIIFIFFKPKNKDYEEIKTKVIH